MVCSECRCDPIDCESIDVDRLLLLDGGSDDHCTKPSFGEGNLLEPTGTKLRGAQKNSISLECQRNVPMLMGEMAPGNATFQIGQFSRNFLSVGKLYDTDFNLVVSKRLGCYMGRYCETTSVHRL